MDTSTDPQTPGLGREAYLCRIEADAGLLSAAASAAGPNAAIPTCPGWTIRDLMHHQGEVHRWATTIVRDGLAKPSQLPADFRGPLPGDDHLVPWFETGVDALVDALRAAPADLQCFTFLADTPPPAEFWARRQTHETGMHRVDAESATGSITPMPAQFAADGIDEMLTGFVPRKNTPLHADPPVTLAVSLTDADDVWDLTINEGTPVALRESRAADCTVNGAASDVYLALWNRQGVEPLTITGDRSVLDNFRANITIRWN